MTSRAATLPQRQAIDAKVKEVLQINATKRMPK